jgi:hypothetical protein
MSHDHTTFLGRCVYEHTDGRVYCDYDGDPLYEVRDEDGAIECIVTLAEFTYANGSDPETCDIVRALGEGEARTLGGGAAPQFTVKRLTPLT